MADYAEAVKAHARVAVQVYKQKLSEIEKLAGFKIFPNGGNGAKTGEDAKRYVRAIQTVCGPTAYVSAKLLIEDQCPPS